MHNPNERAEAADRGESECQQSRLSREQHEFARVFGTLLAEKWRESHSTSRIDSAGNSDDPS
ncbi:MAG: hypothetical protein H6822_28315 [Planctomycetaceae bacterium]|nr:hypothetical protein [Planctomycetales bacterium]MCB9926086.1 hypothetical protein [Planctomycetaceae bacterium]